MGYQERDFDTPVSRWTQFRGRTVGELVSFLQRFPPSSTVVLPTDEVLMVREHEADLLLRHLHRETTGGIPSDQLNASNDG